MSQKNVRTLTPQELKNLYMVADSERDYMLLKITAKHGLRNSEAVSLQKKDIELKESRVNISESKNDKDRYVPIPGDFIEELRIFVSDFSQEDYLFPSKRSPTHLTTRAFQQKMREYSLKAGLYPSGTTEEDVSQMPYSERVMPHTLRHTYATQLLKAGVEMPKVSRLLGHDSIKTTVDTYGNLIIEDLREAVEVV
jgi:integrase/recombinase XerD